MPARPLPAQASPKQRADTALAALQSHASARIRDELAPRYGIIAPTALGVPMSRIKVIAKDCCRDRALAESLWSSGVYEARLLAAMVDEPEKVTRAQMDRWRKDFDNWGVCDTVCFHLFDRTPHALSMIDKWASRHDEFGRRAAFALLACVALHRRDLGDAVFVERLPLIRQTAIDERNFVKKAVSWALKAIGTRNAKLNAQARSLATELAEADNKTARWIGKDVLRGLKPR